MDIESILTNRNRCKPFIVELRDIGTVIIERDFRNFWANNPSKGWMNITPAQIKMQAATSHVLCLGQSNIKFNKRVKPSFLWSTLLADKTLFNLAIVIIILSFLKGLTVLLDPVIKNIYFTNVVQMGILDWARTLSILYFIVAVLGGILLVSATALSLLLTTRLSLKWSFNAFTALMRVPLEYIEIRASGDLMNRVRSSEQLGSFIGTNEIQLIGSMLNLVLLAFVLFSTSIPLAFIFIGFQVLAFGFVIKTNPGLKTRIDHLQQDSAMETTSFVKLFKGIDILRDQRRQLDAFRVHQLVVNRRIRTQQKTSTYSLMVKYGSTVIDTFQSIIMLTIAAIFIMNGQITLGEYVAFSAIISLALAPVKSISQFISSLQSIRTTHERILDVIEESSLQYKYGIQSTANNELLVIQIKDELEEENINKKNSKIQENQIILMQGGPSRLLLTDDYQSSIDLEAIIAGDNLLHDQIKMSVLCIDGRRELLVARSQPYIYSSSLRQNLTLGQLDSPLASLGEAESIAEHLGVSIKSLQQGSIQANASANDLHRIGVFRALWRAPRALIITDLPEEEASSRYEFHKRLIKLSEPFGIDLIRLSPWIGSNDSLWPVVFDLRMLKNYSLFRS
jgi:ABC-type bacteriocin/lantibiotic exporter with double-glycine peptidase domain